MASTFITATPGVLFIDAGAGQMAGTSRIDYDSLDPVVIWHRFNLGTWTRLNLFKLVGTKNADHKGRFQTDPLTPGDLRQYRMYQDAAIDPNLVSDAQFTYRQVDIQAFVLQPDARDWIRDGNTQVGGTFYFRQIATPPRLTTIRAEVSPFPPFTDKYGQLQFKAPEQVLQSFLTTNHVFELKPLLPGTPYYATFRMSDSKGNWYYVFEKFITLQRKVTVALDSIYIDNDGDPFSSGEASFSVKVYEGDNQIDEVAFGDDEFSVTDGQTVAITHQTVVGPKQVTQASYSIGLNASGTEYDGWLESDEHADTWGSPPDLKRQLDFPAGRFVEQMTNQAFSVEAIPGSVDDDFRFTVKGRYSVEYL